MAVDAGFDHCFHYNDQMLVEATRKNIELKID